MKSEEYLNIDADVAGEYYLRLTEVEQQLEQKLEGDLQVGKTDGPRAVRVLVTLGQLMGKLETNRCTEDEWKMIQSIVEEQ
jgi:hypothetical protein